MESLGRRKFLSSAVLGTAAVTTVVGASSLGSFAPEAVGSDLKVEAGAPDPNFVEGRIISVKNGVLLVTSADKSIHQIHLTGATSVWKLRPTAADAAKVGDGLYARGVRMPDGTLAADAVWLNIVNLTVHITSIGRDTMHLDHHGDRIVGHVIAGTTAAVYNSTPAVSDLSLLQVGKHAQVIGAWRPDTNEVDLATVYAAA
ncbi:cell wall protein [Actinophytocola sp.]|uniref:cell wall protein n=1 Tax=Actinophytocola sp. TaxID=1872138 RepID=UPI003D6BD49B